MSFFARLNKEKGPVAGRRHQARRWLSLWLLAGAGLFLLGLLVGLYLFFPVEVLKQRIIQEVATRTGAQLQIEQLTLYPLLTLDAKQVKFDLAGLPQELEVERLSISPQWSTLLSGDPGAQLHANIMSGAITGGLQKSGAFSAKAAGLRFDIPLQKPLHMNITGTLTESILDSALHLGPEIKSQLSLRLIDVRILGLEILKAGGPGLTLGAITLEMDGQGQALRINSLTATGGDLEVTGEGTLLFGRSLSTSRIKLALQISTGPNADPTITSLLQIAGEADKDGRYPVRLSGTLANPILKSGG